jgi:hypothetical protein
MKFYGRIISKRSFNCKGNSLKVWVKTCQGYRMLEKLENCPCPQLIKHYAMKI